MVKVLPILYYTFSRFRRERRKKCHTVLFLDIYLNKLNKIHFEYIKIINEIKSEDTKYMTSIHD